VVTPRAKVVLGRHLGDFQVLQAHLAQAASTSAAGQLTLLPSMPLRRRANTPDGAPRVSWITFSRPEASEAVPGQANPSEELGALGFHLVEVQHGSTACAIPGGLIFAATVGDCPDGAGPLFLFELKRVQEKGSTAAGAVLAAALVRMQHPTGVAPVIVAFKVATSLDHLRLDYELLRYMMAWLRFNLSMSASDPLGATPEVAGILSHEFEAPRVSKGSMDPCWRTLDDLPVQCDALCSPTKAARPK